MSEIEEQLTEVSLSLKKIQGLSVKIKRHYFQRQNTRKQVNTLKKFIYLDEFITSKLSELSTTQSGIQILSQLNCQIDDLQIKVKEFESCLNDEYWDRYCEIQSSLLPKDYLNVEENLNLKRSSKSCPEMELYTLSTSESFRCEEVSRNSCKCGIF